MVTPAESALIRLSVDNLLEGVQVVGFDWRYLYVNTTAATHGRRAADQLVGRTMMEAYPGIDQTPLYEVLERVMRRRAAESVVNEFDYGDGHTRWFELRVEPVPNGICILSLDVTERLAAEAQLRHAQKMEAIGQLAAGIAHDFNNVLTAILGYSTLITEQIGVDKPIGADLREIVLAAQRAAGLSRQLLAFGRKQEIHPVALSLNAVVGIIEPMLRRLLPPNILLRTELAAEAHPVLAVAALLEQVVLNLIVNARDAMPLGGTITIATHNATLDAPHARLRVGIEAGEYAVLTVADTGVGMPADVQSRIFEPFFSTKEPGRGSGLGLAVVHGIVKQLGGAVLVESERERGTVFSVYLPKTEATAEAIEAGTQPARSSVGHETILLVEDEPSVRSLARRVLERHGYRVSDVDSGEAALAMIEKASRLPDLLITDITLPGMNGAQLVRAMSRTRPPRTLFMSGYVTPSGVPTPDDAEWLEKPFTAQMLLTRVREILSRPAA
jgi:two-component system, cell cycle sensor histidine kinase and response regulator CckA